MAYQKQKSTVEQLFSLARELSPAEIADLSLKLFVHLCFHNKDWARSLLPKFFQRYEGVRREA